MVKYTMSPSGHWNPCYSSVQSPLFGEIHNEPFGALKHRNHRVNRSNCIDNSNWWNTQWALRGIETWQFATPPRDATARSGEIHNEPFGALKQCRHPSRCLANSSPLLGEIHNEPFGALKLTAAVINARGTSARAMVKYTMSPSGHWNRSFSILIHLRHIGEIHNEPFGALKLIVQSEFMPVRNPGEIHNEPFGALKPCFILLFYDKPVMVKYTMSPSGHVIANSSKLKAKGWSLIPLAPFQRSCSWQHNNSS